MGYSDVYTFSEKACNTNQKIVKKVKCPECPRQFSSNNDDKLLRHIRAVHRGENPFQCYMCDYSSQNKVVFAEHVRRHKGTKPFKCSYCPHRNVSKKNLKKHELIHRPDNPLKCQICGHLARHKRSFEHHAKTFHSAESKVNSCPTCKAVLPENVLSKHLDLSKKCDECDFSTCTKALLSEHLMEVHGKKFLDKFKFRNKPWTCAVCGWKGNRYPRILLHLIHHPDQDVQDIDVSILKPFGIMK
ncbi:zinc finger protein 676-like [Leptidea sinapis]|uniref:zinc finger protein 676-like n=1 Tax=Leptidea sinapis TaxID=189913 RepID=UPI0021C3248C|nr:zinc finger protein 676-like [Leptidea sinapis]